MGQTRSEIVPSNGFVTRRLTRVTQSGIGMTSTVVRRVGGPHGVCEPRGGLDTRGLAQRTRSCIHSAGMSTVETSDRAAREGGATGNREESLVLTLTDTARTAVHTLTTKAGLPDETGGLRIAQQEAGGFALALVPEPFPGDDVVTDGSTRVYVDPEASATLADQRLDVEPAADGTMFTLGPQQ